MDVACFKWNISSRVNLIGYPDLELWNIDPNSASNTYYINIFIMLESVKIYPFYLLVLLNFWVPRKNALLRKF